MLTETYEVTNVYPLGWGLVLPTCTTRSYSLLRMTAHLSPLDSSTDGVAVLNEAN